MSHTILNEENCTRNWKLQFVNIIITIKGGCEGDSEGGCDTFVVTRTHPSLHDN
jgi:hypothetical protein